MGAQSHRAAAPGRGAVMVLEPWEGISETLGNADVGAIR